MGLEGNREGVILWRRSQRLSRLGGNLSSLHAGIIVAASADAPGAICVNSIYAGSASGNWPPQVRCRASGRLVGKKDPEEGGCAMVMTDPIADMLTRVRNANSAKHDSVDIPVSKLKVEVARILKEEGYVRDYKVIDDGKHGFLRVYLKYGANKQLVISGIKRISKPGLRVYAKKDEIPRVLGGLGIAILSTSQGVMTDKMARKERIGGEVLCYVW